VKRIVNWDIDSSFQPFLDMSDMGDNDDESPATLGARKHDRANEAASATATIMKGMFDQVGCANPSFLGKWKVKQRTV
jgi:hypothetical protein